MRCSRPNEPRPKGRGARMPNDRPIISSEVISPTRPRRILFSVTILAFCFPLEGGAQVLSSLRRFRTLVANDSPFQLTPTARSRTSRWICRTLRELARMTAHCPSAGEYGCWRLLRRQHLFSGLTLFSGMLPSVPSLTHRRLRFSSVPIDETHSRAVPRALGSTHHFDGTLSDVSECRKFVHRILVSL